MSLVFALFLVAGAVAGCTEEQAPSGPAGAGSFNEGGNDGSGASAGSGGTSNGVGSGGAASNGVGGEGSAQGGAGGGPLAQDPIAGVESIWAIHDGEKIHKDDLDSPYELSNAAWDGETIRLFGARNEVIAFQVIVETGDAGTKGLDVKLPVLKEVGGSAAITYVPPAEDPTEYAGRPIQIFTENYMFVEQPSKASWRFSPGGASVPPNPTGWKPVQLVPENATAGRGGLPIDVAPMSNQAFWIDVYTARDLPAGKYTGYVEISAGGASRHIPVELTLLDFTLPDESSLDVMLYFESEQVPLYMGDEKDLVARFHRFGHRNRVELVHAYDVSSLGEAMGRFDGSDFGASKGYDGPGQDVGNRIAPASFYGPPPAYESKASAWAASDQWMTYLKENLPGAITFLYMPDEPGSGQFDEIQKMASFIHANPGPGKALPTFVTSSYKPGLDGAIDIWCSLTQAFDVDVAEQQRALGHEYWFYNGHRPHSGAVVIESPATDVRVNPWIAFKHGVEVYFFWHADHWLHNSQKQGEKEQNVWADPITFDNIGQPNKPLNSQGYVNGDGVLVYPGKEVLHPEEDRGIAGPISTVQLANLRRGAQDHLYLTLARELGLDDVVEDALQSVVPAVLSDADGQVGFSEHGDDYEIARRKLADAIAAARK